MSDVSGKQGEANAPTPGEARRPGYRLKLFLAFIATITLVQAGLGFWQWERRKEKAAFIAALAAATDAAPRPFAGAPLWSKVEITGRFAHERSAFVRTSRPAGKDNSGGFGVMVMTPLVTRLCGADGRCTLANVYVNRGYVPTPPDGRIPAFDRPEDPVTLTGILRPSEGAGLFQPSNDPARKVWFSRDTRAMAQAEGLPGTQGQPATGHDAPYGQFIDRIAAPGENAPPQGLDLAGLIRSVPDNHLQYALTWWGLALTNIVILGFFLAARGKRAAPR